MPRCISLIRHGDKQVGTALLDELARAILACDGGVVVAWSTSGSR
jgi:hypothetical protein